MNSNKTLSIPNNLKVLLVETNKEKAHVLECALQKTRYQVVRVSNFGMSLLKQVELEQPDIMKDIREKVEEIIEQRLQELTPQLVKEIIQAMIKQHLGWLVVWGGVFGGLIGLLAALITL